MSKGLYEEAKQYIPGGVNSPVRAFKAVGGEPVFVKQAQGSKVYGECGREFIDYCLSWGALILGHAHPVVVKALKEAIENGTSFGTATRLETELAKLIVKAIPSIEQVRLTNSGTEAVMSAIRLARAYTKKNKIIKFEGSYHGHADYLLVNPAPVHRCGVKAGSGQTTLGMSDSLGVPKDFTKHTIVPPFNNIKRVEEIAKKYQKDLAAIIVEPVAGNMGVVLPKPGFLQDLRRIADKYNIVLIFDEVITGFRLTYGSSQEYFDIKADLTCLGKIIGGGLPCGAFGGRKEIMELLAPEGLVYQSGTFSGNPLTVSAGLVTLRILSQENPYKRLENMTRYLCENITQTAKKYGIQLKINFIGSMFSIFFVDKEVMNYNIAKTQDTKIFKRFYHGLLKEGIYFSPSGFEANFLSTAHTDEDLEKTLKIIDKTFDNLRRK